jgi:hypothetical protein
VSEGGEGSALVERPLGGIAAAPGRSARQRFRRRENLFSGARFYLFVAALCGLAYAEAQFISRQTWGLPQYAVLMFLAVVGFSAIGLSLRSLTFSAAATIPSVVYFIPVGSRSVTLCEVFMVLFLAVFFLRGGRLALGRFGMLLVAVYLSCLLSLLGSPLGLDTVGVLIRFGALLLFVCILVSRRGAESLVQPLVYGLLAIPLVGVAGYSGEGMLYGMFAGNVLQLSRVVYSFQYPIWFALALPLLMLIGAPRPVLWLASLVVVYLIVMSFARSIIIGTGAAGFFYVAFYRDTRPVRRALAKAGLIVGMIGVLVVATVGLQFFDFTSAANPSSQTRYYKLGVALRSFRDHPVLGAGFATSNTKAFAQRRGAAEILDDFVSPEFGPMTALGEIGLVGSLFLFAAMGISMMRSARCLRDTDIPLAFKFVVLITFGGWLSTFLNSNSLTSIIVYIFMGVPLVIDRYFRGRGRHTAAHP